MKKDNESSVPIVLEKFAESMGTKLKGRRLEIPKKFGSGYCAGFVFNNSMRMLILNLELHEDIVLENPDIDVPGKIILFKFQNIFPSVAKMPTRQFVKSSPSVLIATSNINIVSVITVDTNTASVNIEVESDYLNGLLDSSKVSPVLKSLLQNSQPLLFEQIIYPSLQRIVDEIITESINETFEVFFMRVKAEELICRLLMELEKRNEKHFYSLNSNDVQTIYKVKDRILTHLGIPPVISDLASSFNMSPSKLKRLFKQIFGNSIFSYYQEFRMKEAARLLKEEKRSVSDVGYELGFTNLSHFSRVFKEHHGIKPKQYSSSYN